MIDSLIEKYKINRLNKKIDKEMQTLNSLNEYKKICKIQMKNEQHYYIHTDTYKRNYDYCIDDIRISKEKIKLMKNKLNALVEKVSD